MDSQLKIREKAKLLIFKTIKKQAYNKVNGMHMAFNTSGIMLL